MADDPSSEGTHRLAVVGHRVVVVVPFKDLASVPARGSGGASVVLISVLTALSLERIFFLLVTRPSLNRPCLSFAQMCVKPRNSNLSASGRHAPWLRSAAYRPNSISRVFSGQLATGFPRTARGAQRETARRPHGAGSPPGSRRRTAQQRPRALAGVSIGRPTGRTRSAGRRSRAAVIPMRAPRGAKRKEMTDINISSVPAGMPALGCCSGPEKLGTAKARDRAPGGQASRQRDGRAALPDARVRASETER